MSLRLGPEDPNLNCTEFLTQGYDRGDFAILR